MFWIKQARQQANSSQKFEEDCLQLNVQGNQEVILKWRGRIQGHYPIFLPDSLPFICKLLHRSHVNTLHGGEALTMTKVWQLYWVPHLRALIKKLLRECSGCKQFFLYACSLTCGLFLEVLPNLATSEFLRSLKRLIACYGCMEKIYSDNGKTFVGAKKWLKQVMRDKKTQDFSAHENIKWQFNLSRTAWWGGQFKCLVRLVKTALNKTIGCRMLT